MKRRKGRQRQQQQQQQQEGAFSRALRLLHLPEDALVAILLAARPSLRALSCSCKQLNLLVRHSPQHADVDSLVPSLSPMKGCQLLLLRLQEPTFNTIDSTVAG
jgi:hypothetical protein